MSTISNREHARARREESAVKGENILLKGARSLVYFGAFPAFLIGAVAFLLMTTVRTIGMNPHERAVLARRFIHRGARFMFATLQWLGLVDLVVEPEDGEWLGADRSSVVVANHPSMLDAMLLLSFLPNAVCIMKRSLSRVPVLSHLAAAAGYIPHADPPELLAHARGALASGASVVIFPEGTRSPAASVGSFRRGAAWMAVETSSRVVLFVLSMEPVVLGRGLRWWRVPSFPVRYKAVRMMVSEGESEGVRGHDPEEARAAAVQLTRTLEDCVHNSLSYRSA